MDSGTALMTSMSPVLHMMTYARHMVALQEVTEGTIRQAMQAPPMLTC